MERQRGRRAGGAEERIFIGAAVPQLAVAAAGDFPATARVVVCHVTALARHGPPAGPVGRDKGLLDALLDNRRSGPFYRDLGVSPPLVDDDPAHVGVLAVGVTPGHPRTRYLIGTEFRIDGQLVASVLAGLVMFLVTAFRRDVLSRRRRG